MTQEDKELLLKDLSARLPYNVKVDITYSKEHGSSDRLRICSEGCLTLNTDVFGLYIQDEIYLKPYLRPMSSMTEEEMKEYYTFQYKFTFQAHEHQELNKETFSEYLDWLNARHFDFRGLIKRELAIEVTEENNLYET